MNIYGSSRYFRPRLFLFGILVNRKYAASASCKKPTASDAPTESSAVL